MGEGKHSRKGKHEEKEKEGEGEEERRMAQSKLWLPYFSFSINNIKFTEKK